MAGKKASADDVTEQSTTSGADGSELVKLRQIVFGAAQADIESRIAQLETDMQASFQRAETAVNQHVQDLTVAMQKGIDVLTEKVNSVDQHHEDKTAELQSYADKLSSELEMSDAAGKQDSDELHVRVDKEVAQLTEKYDARFAEALERLDQVTKELSSTKTDRKTLAKLLATMAINLETDED